MDQLLSARQSIEGRLDVIRTSGQAMKQRLNLMETQSKAVEIAVNAAIRRSQLEINETCAPVTRETDAAMLLPRAPLDARSGQCSGISALRSRIGRLDSKISQFQSGTAQSDATHYRHAMITQDLLEIMDEGQDGAGGASKRWSSGIGFAPWDSRGNSNAITSPVKSSPIETTAVGVQTEEIDPLIPPALQGNI